MPNNLQVSVLGGGSFGTVLANLAASNNCEVNLWVRDSEQALRINSESSNSSYHPELQLSNNIVASDNLEECITTADIVFVAIPSSIFENIILRMKPFLDPKTFVVSCTKGISKNKIGPRTMSGIIREHLRVDEGARVGVLSGPNLAKEIADNKVAGTVIASQNLELISLIRQTLNSDKFKVYSSNDMEGIEYAGALKNIYAICCGIGDELAIGENALGLVITRSMAEMSRFAVAKGADPITFLGLAGMGDLVATCTSKLSRNFSLGTYIAQGLHLNDAKDKVGQVAEGVKTLDVIYEEARKIDLNMPLLFSLHNIIYNGAAVTSLLDDLINHPGEHDVEFVYKK